MGGGGGGGGPWNTDSSICGYTSESPYCGNTSGVFPSLYINGYLWYRKMPRIGCIILRQLENSVNHEIVHILEGSSSSRASESKLIGMMEDMYAGDM